MKESKASIYYLALTGILMGLVIAVKAIFNFIPVVYGYPLDFYIAFYILALLLINNRYWQWTFGVITPWVLLLIPSGSANFVDLIFEYILTLYVFLGFIYFDLFVKYCDEKIKNKKWNIAVQIITFSLLLIICFGIKLLIHVVAGVWWWTPGKWIGSLAINAPIIGVNLGIALPIIIILYPSINHLKLSGLGRT